MSSKYEHHSDIAGLMAEFDHARAKSRERRAVLEEALPALSFTSGSPDGAVEVAVNWEGLLTGVRIGEAARGLEPRQLAESVLRAYTMAQQEAARRAAELFLDAGGSSNAFSDRLRARQDFEPTMLGEPQLSDGTSTAGTRFAGSGPANDLIDDDFDDPDQHFLRG